LGVNPRVFHRLRRCAHGEADRPAHQLGVFPVLAEVWRDIEFLHLSRDLDRLARSVKTLDVADTRSPLQDRLAELSATDSVGCDDSDARHHDAPHAIPTFKDV